MWNLLRSWHMAAYVTVYFRNYRYRLIKKVEVRSGGWRLISSGRVCQFGGEMFWTLHWFPFLSIHYITVCYWGSKCWNFFMIRFHFHGLKRYLMQYLFSWLVGHSYCVPERDISLWIFPVHQKYIHIFIFLRMKCSVCVY